MKKMVFGALAALAIAVLGCGLALAEQESGLSVRSEVVLVTDAGAASLTFWGSAKLVAAQARVVDIDGSELELRRLKTPCQAEVSFDENDGRILVRAIRVLKYLPREAALNPPS